MSIEDDIELLARVPTFSALGYEALRVLAIGADSRSLQEGEVLCEEGEPADAGFVVEDGSLAAKPRPPETRPMVLGRGTLLGEISLLVETTRPATIVAAEPSSVMRIPRALFIKMLQGYPEVAERMRQHLLQRTQELSLDLGAARVALDISAPPLVPRRPPAVPDEGA